MIDLRSASLSFGNRRLFSPIDLVVRPGELTGIAGESGCGKTSLLRAVLGFVPLTADKAMVCGLPLDIRHIDAIRRQTSYVPQELQPPAATGADLVRLTHDLDCNRRQENRPPYDHPPFNHKPFNHRPFIKALPSSASPLAPSMLKVLGLDASLMEQDASKLSGGQRQRLLLAAALSLPKRLLLLDEPSSALDEESTQRVALALLRACHEEGRAALVVSHDAVLLSFCDQVVTLTP